MQVFGGEGGIARAAVPRNATVAQAIDNKYGWDLKKQNALEMTHHVFNSTTPKFASIELPCTYYTNRTHLNYSAPRGKQVLQRQRRAERPFLHLSLDFSAFQLDLGDVTMIENPAASRIWARRALARFAADRRARQVRYLRVRSSTL